MSAPRTCLFGLIQPLVASLALAQCDPVWTRVATAGPGAREGAFMVHDARAGRTVLFGGAGEGGERFNDTWAWEGSSWALLAESGETAARGWGGSAYDGARDAAVIFGGNSINNATNFGDTWEWSGAAWTQASVIGPSQRCCIGMTYDSTRRRTLLFGGSHLGASFADTWEWDGYGWALAAVAGPSQRYAPALAEDPARGRVVFFGGSTIWGSSPIFQDTWEWGGTAWTEMRPAASPPARRFHQMAYDPVRRAVILFGGATNTEALFGDTWSWDGVVWTPIADAGPAPRRAPAMVYDERMGGLLMFGGFGGTSLLGDAWLLPSPLGFIRQPRSATLCGSGSIEQAVVAAEGGGGPASLRWQVEESAGWRPLADGSLIVDGSVWGRVSGSGTGRCTFTHDPAGAAAPIRVRCMAANACGEVASDEVLLGVCPPEFNCDGFVDFFDYDDYVRCFETADCPPGRSADFNGDGFTDFFDYDEFVWAYERGC